MIHFIWQALSCTSTFPLSSQSSFPPLNAFPNSGSSELRILLVLRFPGPVLLHVMMPHIYRNLWNAMWNLQVISKSSLELGFFFCEILVFFNSVKSWAPIKRRQQFDERKGNWSKHSGTQMQEGFFRPRFPSGLNLHHFHSRNFIRKAKVLAFSS